MSTIVVLDAVLAAPSIPPNNSGLPGGSEAEKIVGALLTFGLIAAVAGKPRNLGPVSWA